VRALAEFERDLLRERTQAGTRTSTRRPLRVAEYVPPPRIPLE
jgi:DNA invertase Pin-like site-specific DNA recombinase